MENSLEEHPDEGEGLCGLVKEGGGEWVSKCMNEGRRERGSMVGREIRRRLVKRVREKGEVSREREGYGSGGTERGLLLSCPSLLHSPDQEGRHL